MWPNIPKSKAWDPSLYPYGGNGWVVCEGLGCSDTPSYVQSVHFNSTNLGNVATHGRRTDHADRKHHRGPNCTEMLPQRHPYANQPTILCASRGCFDRRKALALFVSEKSGCWVTQKGFSVAGSKGQVKGNITA